MIASQVSTALRTLATTHGEVAPLMSLLRSITIPRMQSKFYTVILLRLLPETGEVCCASAGQPAYVLDADGAVRVAISPRLPVVTASVDSPKEPPLYFHLRPGDLILLFSDGITESRRDGELFDDERMLEVVAKNRSASADTIVNRLLAAAAEFVGANVQADDMTAVVVKRME